MRPRIYVSSVFVDDQAKALAFYTEKLGFVVKNDIPIGAARWLTVVSPDAPDGVELLLEPNEHPAALAYQQALVEDGIPCTSFMVDDVAAAYAELVANGVRALGEPADMGTTTAITVDDTCGNLLQFVSMNE
ncbi:VOC family protein [Gordonia sp. CPCC 205333]|uniref:VOC family protein n=1 Tax=Gordonia sp. CPCC 205333 TaxID=3140790 RepID=UPI003AF384F8